ncbi:hypothetical protein HOP50_05g37670 [Chloropicon primus]|uniref:Uncharacterized protein n=1 Tax=Chloropicon primus TaxID=1764295 RepID=A0A5B8MLE5_9CHLO|nr:hypothetical protein A3770_05p37570 [Chloropicon primus]UPR00453.1 hypothetical protein HOP50_05g37670 [Chloropicon primus]|eukprot:QDZ21239.1 hypothetical protein A3770_05p37570 [Chloropicon primus]
MVSGRFDQEECRDQVKAFQRKFDEINDADHVNRWSAEQTAKFMELCKSACRTEEVKLINNCLDEESMILVAAMESSDAGGGDLTSSNQQNLQLLPK